MLCEVVDETGVRMGEFVVTILREIPAAQSMPVGAPISLTRDREAVYPESVYGTLVEIDGSRLTIGSRLVMQLARECLEGEELSNIRLQVELSDTRAVLHRLCEVHGDNDWDDTLYLADALDKHLGNYLND